MSKNLIEFVFHFQSNANSVFQRPTFGAQAHKLHEILTDWCACVFEWRRGVAKARESKRTGAGSKCLIVLRNPQSFEVRTENEKCQLSMMVHRARMCHPVGLHAKIYLVPFQNHPLPPICLQSWYVALRVPLLSVCAVTE